MAEGTKVRVVRCPKCENLLPELPGYTVYQCGGCGAVLRAKKQTSASDGSSEKFGEGDSGKLEQFSDEVAANLGDTSGTDRESDGPELERRRRRPERVVGSNATSSSPVFMEVMSDNNEGIDKTLGKEAERPITEPKYGYLSKTQAEDRVVVNDQEMKLRRDELAKAQLEKEVIGMLKSQTASVREPLGYGKIPDKQSSEEEGSMAFWRTSEPVVEDFRLLTPQYPDDGPSNHHRGSSYGYGEPRTNQSNFNGPSRVEHFEQDRTELLRKLDELKAQLSRSCDMTDIPKEGVPLDRRTVPRLDPYGGYGAWLPESLPGPSRAAMPSFAPDKHVPRQAYFSQDHESIPLMNRHHVDVQQNFHSPLQTPNGIPGYNEGFGHQMLQRAPHQPSHQYSQRPSHEYSSGHYTHIDSEPLALYPHNSFFDQATCSCLHCYNKHWQVPGHIPPPVYGNRRYPDIIPTSSMFHHLEASVPFGSQGYNPRAFNLPVYPRDPHNHARRPSLVDSEMGGFHRGRPQRVVIANGNRRRCHPVIGGAPFITCHICFELLRLPKKLISMERNEWKVRCGACSTVIPIAVENKRLLVSVLDETIQTHPELPGGYNEVMTGLSRHNGYTNKAGTNSSDDYDNPEYFKFTEADHASLEDDHRLNLSESKVHDLLYSSLSPSEDEESPDSVITGREISNAAKPPPRANVTPLVPGSPLHRHPDHSFSDVVSKLERGSRSERLDQEKVVLNKVTLRQDSLKDASVATEMEVSFNEYLFRNSGEASKEEDQSRASKGGESFFVGLIKKSFRDFSRSNQPVENGKANVSINGHPIPDRLVRKAEKLAGPIQPGKYWYDSRAGFWGVIGQPCLGIIPPFIEEFNYPMPQNCAGGNTGILLNGRELHQKDLDLLAGRGLPITRDKSYIVEISGKILDKDTGEELDSLGKLAPTVEKLKHGFGMQVPRMDV